MLVAYFLLSLFYFNCKSENLLYDEEFENENLITCVTGIVEKYFSKDRSLTYVNIESNDDFILKAIHSSEVTTLVSRQATTQSHFRHQEYLITANNVTKFTEKFEFLLQEATWNPYARFLIIIKSLKEEDLKKIFDALLRSRTINVLVVNGTEDAELYTYNPYENYGCGKFYSRVISYGLCRHTTHNLFPDKLVTGLKNCTILATVGDKPPYSFHPSDASVRTPGTEQYLFKILAEQEEFNVNCTFDYDKRYFSIITDNMQVTGPMEKLKNNETDVMFGGTVLVASRADAFTYLHGYLDYDDELRFLVKRASLKAIWKSAYLEFQPFVWCLFFFVFFSYSTVMILLLHSEDKTEIMLKLFSSLLLHGFKMPRRMSAKFFFIIWVWFAYIMNSTYQSNLVSLTTNPVFERQISTEMDLYRYNLKPCISPALLLYIYSETNRSTEINKDCLDNLENVKLVARSDNLFTIAQQSLFKYYKKTYNDEFGRSPVYSFKKPYAKVILGYFFSKGFPITERMRKNAIRLRENGLVDKSLKDHYFARKIKYHFHKKGFETRLVIPWWSYTTGCVASTIIFAIELLYARCKK